MAGRRRRTAFQNAIAAGDAAAVRRLVAQGAEVDPVWDKFVEPPLETALRARSPAMIELLVELGADADRRRFDGSGLLALAASVFGDAATVRALLRAGAAVDVAAAGGATPVAIVAGSRNDAEAAAKLELLLAAGADPDRAEGLYTPLALASFEGSEALVARLVAAGADVNLSRGGTTPLLAACAGGHLAVARLLLEAGADVHVAEERGGAREGVLERAGARLTPALLELLIAHGLEIGSAGAEVLRRLARCEARQRPVVAAVAGRLLDLGLVPDEAAVADAVAAGFAELLEVYRRRGHADAARARAAELLRAVEHADAAEVLRLVRSLRSETAALDAGLLRAAALGRVEVVADLLDGGARVEARDRDGMTALMHACVLGDVDLVGLLLDRGADVNAASAGGVGDGRSGLEGARPLHFAIGPPAVERDARRGLNSRAALMRRLLAGGARVDVRTVDGASPTEFACGSCDFATVLVLTAAGGEITARALQAAIGNANLRKIVRRYRFDEGALREVRAAARRLRRREAVAELSWALEHRVRAARD